MESRMEMQKCRILLIIGQPTFADDKNFGLNRTDQNADNALFFDESHQVEEIW